MNTRRLTATTSLIVLSAFTAIMTPVASVASTAGKRNTAIGLTAGTIYTAIKGKKTAAIVLGAGAAYAWKRHADSRKSDAYNKGYNRGLHRGNYRSSNRGLHKGFYKAQYKAHPYKSRYAKKSTVQYVRYHK